jgi:hypothetical protein
MGRNRPAKAIVERNSNAASPERHAAVMVRRLRD